MSAFFKIVVAFSGFTLASQCWLISLDQGLILPFQRVASL